MTKEDSEFAKSYDIFEQYPTQLVYPTTYKQALEDCKKRFDDASSRMCIDKPSKMDVGIRDFAHSGAKVAKNIKSEAFLEQHLGYSSCIDPTTGLLTISPSTRQDPACRFMYVAPLERWICLFAGLDADKGHQILLGTAQPCLVESS